MSIRRTVFALSISLLARGVAADDIEPRRWTPLPVGTTVFGAGVIRSEGQIAFDPVLQIESATVETTTTLVSVIRAFDLLGQTARLDVQLPHKHSRWEGLLGGELRSVDRRGPGDPRLRLSVNFVGSPALRGREFQAYRASHPVNTIAGAALAVTLPLGEYKNDKLLNLGHNRFAITPQLGLVHTRGPWSFEVTGSISFYTKNSEFLVDHTREQDPILALQAHAVHVSPGGWWTSLSTAYDWGGQSVIDGVTKDDSREDFLYGVAAGFAIAPRATIQIAYVANRVQTAIGSDSDNFAIGCSLRF
jgi:hypothetical protein